MPFKPNTKRRQAQFKGPTSSEDYNSMVEENYADLSLLINRSNLAQEELRELASRLYREHLSLQSIIDNLEQRIIELEADQAFVPLTSDSSIDVERFNGTEFDIPVEDRLNLDTIHGVLTLPKVETSSLSRLFFIDDKGDDYVPGSMEPRVVGTSGTADDENADVDESPVSHAILRKPGRLWQRNIIVDAPNDSGAEVTLYVRVPTDLFTVEETNAVVVHPFPAFGMTVRDISYTVTSHPVLRDSDDYIPFNEGGNHTGNLKAVGWIAPGGWTGDWEGEDAAVDAGPRLYYHEPLPITALRITLHQDTYYIDGSRYVYSYGLSRLDIRKDQFLSEGSNIVRFDAPEGRTISSVDRVTPHMWNIPLSEYDDVFDYRVIWETSEGSGNYTTDPVANSSRVWIELNLHDTPRWTPSLTGLEIEYS